MELIDKAKLLEELAKMQQSAVEGEKRNPDDTEWTTMRECYDDAIRTVQTQPTALTITLREHKALPPDPEEGETMWRNRYVCPECKHEWEDEWPAQCDDDCPNCGTRHISPTESEEA